MSVVDATILDLQREIVILNIYDEVRRREVSDLEARVDRADRLIELLSGLIRDEAQFAHIYSMAQNYLFLREVEDAGD